MKKKAVKIKQAKAINHICDKIYMGKDKIEFYPLVKKSKSKTLFGNAFRTAVKKMIIRVIIWFNVLCANAFIASWVAKYSSTIAIAIMVAYLLLTFVAFLCYITSFRGLVLQNTVFRASAVVDGIYKAVESIEVKENNPKANVDAYKKLDAISQIIDSEIVRKKKIQIVNSLKNEFDVDWDFETDSLLISTDKNGELKTYLKRVNGIDDNALGLVSRCYLEEQAVQNAFTNN